MSTPVEYLEVDKEALQLALRVMSVVAEKTTCSCGYIRTFNRHPRPADHAPDCGFRLAWSREVGAIRDLENRPSNVDDARGWHRRRPDLAHSDISLTP